MPEAVRVLRVTEISAAETEGDVADQVAITYSTPDVPPRTVIIDKDKDTVQERQRVIKEDLEAARATPSETLELP